MDVGGILNGEWLPGGIGKGIHSFMHPEEGYEKAEGQAQKYYVDAQGKLQPLVNQGQSQFNRLTGQAEALNNPGQLENQWAGGYTESPYARQAQQEATSSGLDAASSMGLRGSSAALNKLEKSAGNLMQSDRQQYMNDRMQKYLASIGIGQQIYGTGAAAAGGQATNAMNQGTNMAGLAYGKQNAPGEMFGKLAGTAANLGLNYATGGMAGAAKAIGNQVAPQPQYNFNGGVGYA